MVEARQLEGAYAMHDYFFFTFRGGVASELKKTERVVAIPNIVKYNPISWFVGALLSLYHAFKERPDVVITTGAGVVVFFCVFAKMFGARLIFVESMAKIEKPTLTARMLYPFSDLFLVQWPQLQKYFPKAKFLGRVF